MMGRERSVLSVGLVLLLSGLECVLANSTLGPGEQKKYCEEIQMKQAPVGFNQNQWLIPGYGWDNLINQPKKLVVKLTYSRCKMTGQGFILLPDFISAEPLKMSDQKPKPYVIKDWMNAASLTSYSINNAPDLAVPYESISGAFSEEILFIKSMQLKHEALLVRVRMRFKRFKIYLQPSAELDEEFKDRVKDIAADIVLKFDDLASYKAEQLVLDYGTHIVTSIIAGASFVKDDYIRRSYYSMFKSPQHRAAILTAALRSFNARFQLPVTPIISLSQHAMSVVEEYNDTLLLSKSIVQGGSAKLLQEKLALWMENIDTNLTVIDMNGHPLDFMIEPMMFPELPPSLTKRVAQLVYQAILLYYEINTFRGCRDFGEPQFSSAANMDDRNCRLVPAVSQFGGVFQTCETSGDYKNTNPCTNLLVKNNLTDDFSCPKGFQSAIMYQGENNQVEVDKSVCENIETCSPDIFYSKGKFRTYWCAPNARFLPLTLGYMFGGVYTSHTFNPVTNAKNCPVSFVPTRIMQDVYVCHSTDYQTSRPFQVPFQGFFSCKYGNPLSGSYSPMHCGSGYSQFLAASEKNCPLYFCARLENSRVAQPLKKLPYNLKPDVYQSSYDGKLVFDSEKKLWIKMDPETFNPSDTINPQSVAVMAVATGVVCILICICVFLAIYSIRASRRRKSQKLSLDQNRPSSKAQSSKNPTSPQTGSKESWSEPEDKRNT